jgi:hypothetical protein
MPPTESAVVQHTEISRKTLKIGQTNGASAVNTTHDSKQTSDKFPGRVMNRGDRSGSRRAMAAGSAGRTGRRRCGIRTGGGVIAGCAFAVRRTAIPVCVPTAPFQLKGAHGNQLSHLSATLGADRHRGVGYTLLNLKDFFTLTTFVLIHRHGNTSQLCIY